MLERKKNKRVFVIGTMLFYQKSILPIAKKYIDKGVQVYVLGNRKKFSIEEIRQRPRAVNSISREGLIFVANEINLELKYVDEVKFRFYVRRYARLFLKLYLRKNDLVIGTTKDFSILNDVPNGIRRVAIPYQNFSNVYYSTKSNLPFKSLPYNGAEDDLISNGVSCNFKYMGLPYLHLKGNDSHEVVKKHGAVALFLHPGGYRNVVSRNGENLSTCVKLQRTLYRQIESVLPNGAKLLIKIHPLAAQYHTYEDNILHMPEFNYTQTNILSLIEKVDVILSFGSSSWHELKNIPDVRFINLNIFQNDRSLNLFSDEITTVDSLEELSSKLVDIL